MKLIILIVMLVTMVNVTVADSSATSEAKTQLDRSIVCSSLLSDIGIYRVDILTARSMIAGNAKRGSTTQDADDKEKLYQSSLRWSAEIRTAYAALASVVAIYDSVGCPKVELISEMRCPDGWSAKCR